jgi:hypothetical protein
MLHLCPYDELSLKIKILSSVSLISWNKYMTGNEGKKKTSATFG